MMSGATLTNYQHIFEVLLEEWHASAVIYDLITTPNAYIRNAQTSR